MTDANNGVIRGKVFVLADNRTNKLIVITSKADMDFFDRLIKELDTDVEETPVWRVLALRYAKAQDVARNLSAIVKEYQRDDKSADDEFPGYPTTTRPFVGKVVILADERINGLIIVTREINLPFLEHLIDDLDIKLIDDGGKKPESTPVPQKIVSR